MSKSPTTPVCVETFCNLSQHLRRSQHSELHETVTCLQSASHLFASHGTDTYNPFCRIQIDSKYYWPGDKLVRPQENCGKHPSKLQLWWVSQPRHNEARIDSSRGQLSSAGGGRDTNQQKIAWKLKMTEMFGSDEARLERPPTVSNVHWAHWPPPAVMQWHALILLHWEWLKHNSCEIFWHQCFVRGDWERGVKECEN